MKIALVCFILLSSAMSLSALSFGGRPTTNFTSKDIERGYKIVGDIVYKAPGLKDLVASLPLISNTLFTLSYF